MEINPDQITGKERYKLMIGSVLPRPIAFVSTLGKDGVRNLAPFSFYNVVCFNPMIIAFFPLRYKKENEIKDTVKNIRETENFVVNVATEDIAEKLNTTSGLYEYGQDEFEIAGLTPAASHKITAPGVQECSIRMECVLEKMISFGDEQGGADAVFGKVVYMHIRDDLFDDYRIDEQKLRPIARLAGNKYSKLGEIFEIKRPEV